jgi:hypothetical protein
MTSGVQQIQLSYNAEQDRLLFTLTTTDFSEFRFWLTRRATVGFWQMLQKLQEMMGKDEEEQREERVQTSQQIHKETSKPEAAKFTTRVTKCPLGEEPLLLFKFAGKINEQDQIFMHLEDVKGVGIDFSGAGILVTVMTQLMRKAITQADWNIETF